MVMGISKSRLICYIPLVPSISCRKAVQKRITTKIRTVHDCEFEASHFLCNAKYVCQMHRLLQTYVSDKELPKKNQASNKYSWRSHTCGELSTSHINESVKVSGWIQYQRMGKFMILRDRYGIIQLFVPESRAELKELVENLPLESVVAVEGTVLRRPPGQENLRMATGEVEVRVEKLTVLNAADRQLPFSIREYNQAKEAVQMKYRYLSLRFPHIQRNLVMRSKLLMRMREYLCYDCDFLEIETPTLFRRTPGGAQEFVVPTRQPGAFYALTQSPQQLKQLLMVGGLDRYFQVARCYRDEGTRPDRQPEFTQLDIEMSFVDVGGIISLIENLLKYCLPEELGPLTVPFPRITYRDAIRRYGTDKPDTRFAHEIQDVTDIIQKTPGIFSKMLGEDFSAGCLLFPKNSASQSIITKYKEEAKTNFPSVKLLIIKDPFHGALDKMLSPEASNVLREKLQVNDEAMFLAVGPYFAVHELLGSLRVQQCKLLHVKEPLMATKAKAFNFLWVYDFPLFARGDDGRLESAHHPFTQPHPDDLHLLTTGRGLQVSTEARGLHYDLVLNGCEVGGGSLRIHCAALQEEVLQALALDPEPLRHLLRALRAGCPPHGGIALGVDRLVALLCGCESIRDVIAFPKVHEGKDPMSGAPTAISPEEIKLYHLKCTDS